MSDVPSHEQSQKPNPQAPSQAPPAESISRSPQTLQAPWWGRISLLWLMFVPLCVAIYALCLPIAPNDFWYHARAGSVTATTGHFSTTNLFSTGVPLDKPYYNQGWISHWAFYKVLESGGLAWIAMLRAALMALTYSIIVWAAHRRARRVAQQKLRGDETPEQLLELENGAARVAAFAALLTLSMSALNIDVRPQTFSFPLFALFAFVIYEWPTTKARTHFIGLLALCMAAWANLHGAFFTALVVLWMVLLGEIAQSRLALPAFGQAAPLRLLAALAGACTIAAMINPQGPKIFVYVVNLANLPIGKEFIQEWQRPRFELAEWYSLIFFASPLLLLALSWRSKAQRNSHWGAYGVRAGEVLALLALMAMGLRNVRALVWYALFFAPAFAGVFMSFRLRAKAHAGQFWQKNLPATPRAVYVVNAVMALFLLGMIVPATPWIKTELPLPDAYKARFAPTPPGAFPQGFDGDPPLLLENTTPVEAAVFLQKHPPRGLIYNEMVFGSYLMWALYPQARPNTDPRIELYPEKFWRDYLKFQEQPRNAGAILAARGYSDVLCNPKLQKPLVDELSRTPGWKKYTFKSGPAILFRREPTMQ